MGDFRYPFNTRTPGVPDDLTMALAANFRDTASRKYVETATGLLIPKSVLTARGDLLTRDASDPKRLAVGAAGTTLVADGTDPSWISRAAALGSQSLTSGATINPALGAFVFYTGAANGTINLPSAPAQNTTLAIKCLLTVGQQVGVQRSGTDAISVPGASSNWTSFKHFGGNTIYFTYSGSTWHIHALPQFGARLVLVSNVTVPVATVTHIGAGASYWTSEWDSSPGGMVNTGSSPGLYAPVSGVYQIELETYWFIAGTALSLACYLSNAVSSAAANTVAMDHLHQHASYWFGQSANCQTLNAYLPAGTWIYPLAFWNYGGGGNHTIAGTGGAGTDATYMEMRYLGAS